MTVTNHYFLWKCVTFWQEYGKGVSRSHVDNNKTWKERNLSMCESRDKFLCRSLTFLYWRTKEFLLSRSSGENTSDQEDTLNELVVELGCLPLCSGAVWCTYQISSMPYKWIPKTLQTRTFAAFERKSRKSLEEAWFPESSFRPHYMAVELWLREELKIWRCCNQVRTCICIP